MNQHFKETVEKLEIEKDKKINELVKLYVVENARYKVGDFIRTEKINFFIKIEFIDGRFYTYDDGHINICYYGLPYKKVDGKLVRTKSNEIERLGDNAVLIKVNENNMVL